MHECGSKNAYYTYAGKPQNKTTYRKLDINGRITFKYVLICVVCGFDSCYWGHSRCCESGSEYSGWNKRVKPSHQKCCSHIVMRNSEFRLMQFWNYKVSYQCRSLSQLPELCSYFSIQCYDQFLYCYTLNELSNDTLYGNCISTSIISALYDKVLWSCSMAKLSSGQNG